LEQKKNKKVRRGALLGRTSQEEGLAPAL